MTGPAGAAPAATGYARPAEGAPVIRRGDNVRVTIDTQSFSISYAAIAAEDGRVGETITLRGDDRKSKLSATVPGPGRSEEHTSELKSLMRNSYAVFCLKTQNQQYH